MWQALRGFSEDSLKPLKLEILYGPCWYVFLLNKVQIKYNIVINIH